MMNLEEDITLEEFLSAFYPDRSEIINIRVFGAKGDSNIPAECLKTNLNHIKGYSEQLRKFNVNRGIYFVVNSGGAKDEDIKRYTAFFAENDDISIEEQHAALDDAPIQPSIRVETKRSIHAYWLIDGDCSEAEWRGVQEGLISYFGGDKSIKNPSRTMRLPHFNHIALNEAGGYDYKMVEIVAFAPERRFTAGEMRTAFPQTEPSSETESETTCDNVTSVTSSNEDYENWEELNAELGRRIMEAGKLNTRGKYEMPCPVHKGKSQTVLFYDPEKSTMKCLAGCSHRSLLKAFGLPTSPTTDDGSQPEGKVTQADLLVRLTEAVELFATEDLEAYATFTVNDHSETWAINSKTFRMWLSQEYFKIHKRAPKKNALDEALGAIAGEAIFGENERSEVFTRVAELNGAIYLDLCNANWEVIRIDEEGWEILSESPVKFRRTNGMKALPHPEKGGTLEELDRFLNIHGDYLALTKAWLLACLKPRIAYPVLILNGEQGSAKSTAARVLCELVDPNEAALRTEPRNEDDLFIAASNRRIVAFDNLSGVKPSLSDALCRLATGGGHSKRKLYSNAEEQIFNVQNPVLLNGIDDLTTRSDLVDRSIVISLPKIGTRRPESEFWEDFETAKPKIIGALLDAANEALRNFDAVYLDNYPRMADFTKLATAAEKSLDLEDNQFVAIYERNRDEANIVALENSVIVPAIYRILMEQSEWSGNAMELLLELERKSDMILLKNPQFPRNEIRLANEIRRLSPNLRKVGIEVEISQKENKVRQPGTGKRIIKLRFVDQNSSQSSQKENEEQSKLEFEEIFE